MFTLDLEIDPAQVDVESAIESFGLRDFTVQVEARELEPVEKMGNWPVLRLTCEKYLPLKVIAAYYDRTYAIYSDSMVDYIVES